MRYLFVLLLLSGCAQTMTLYPRGGGAPITGNLDTASKAMTVNMDGEIYSGEFIRAEGGSAGVFNTFGAKPKSGTVFVGPSSKQFSALLVSKSGKTLRCAFVGGLMETGNGTCATGDGREFDLLLKP